MHYDYPSVFWIYSLAALFATGAVLFLVRVLRAERAADDEEPDPPLSLPPEGHG